jgi:hypothetical protein
VEQCGSFPSKPPDRRIAAVRHLLALPLSLLALALAACDRVAQALAAINPVQGFEARCDTLPPASVDIVTLPTVVNERYDVPYATLASRHAIRSPEHRTVGLTEVELGHTSTIQFNGIEDRSGRTCIRPVLRVELSATPMTVYVAKEFRGDPCREPVILAHERRHVAVYTDYLNEAAPALASALRLRIGTAPHYGNGSEATRQALERTIQAELSRYRADSARILAARNAELDSPQEYESLGRVCGT